MLLASKEPFAASIHLHKAKQQHKDMRVGITCSMDLVADPGNASLSENMLKYDTPAKPQQHSLVSCCGISHIDVVWRHRAKSSVPTRDMWIASRIQLHYADP